MQSTTVIMLSRDEVPAFLRTGVFFQHLDSSDEERFAVPTNRYKADPSVNNTADLMLLLQTTSFWGLEEPPLTVTSYVVRNHGTLDVDSLLENFPEYERYLNDLFWVGIQTPKFTVFAAIDAGMGLNVVKHLHEHDGFQVHSSALLAVSENDNLPCLKWLLNRGFKWNNLAIVYMLEHGSLQCLRHALENGQSLQEGAMDHAAFSGRPEMVKYLFSLGIKPASDALAYVLHKGNVEIMRILRQAGCAWPHDTLGTLIEYNHLDGLIFAHENGLPLTSSLCAIAAKHGNLSCLEYLHAQGCPWDEDTTYMAVYGGHLDCLQFAHQHGCPMSPMLTTYALRHGREELVPYCMWHGAMDFHVIICCIEWICVLVLRVGLWWTGQCANSVFTVAVLCGIYGTINMLAMISLGPKIAKYGRLLVILSLVKMSWDIRNDGVVCWTEENFVAVALRFIRML